MIHGRNIVAGFDNDARMSGWMPLDGVDVLSR
jgi:hypothetical protein